MRTEGMIYLVDKDGFKLAAKHYKHPSMRREIVAGWRRLYAAAINKCYIHIEPVTNSARVNKDGTNMRGKGIYKTTSLK